MQEWDQLKLKHQSEIRARGKPENWAEFLACRVQGPSFCLNADPGPEEEDPLPVLPELDEANGGANASAPRDLRGQAGVGELLEHAATAALGPMVRVFLLLTRDQNDPETVPQRLCEAAAAQGLRTCLLQAKSDEEW